MSGAAAAARVASRPLADDPDALAALYAEEVTGYLDAVALAPAAPAALRRMADALAGLDPGRLTVVEAPFPAAAPARALATAAANAVAGADVTLFDATRTAGAGRRRGRRPRSRSTTSRRWW